MMKKYGLCKKYKREYASFYSMRTRCKYDFHKQYKDYGGRGIKVCDRWLEHRKGFANFLEDMGTRSEGYSLDRVDKDGDYCPENCRWASRKTQANNMRTNHNIEYSGETHTIAEWAEILDMPSYVLHNRLSLYKWSVERAFTTPYLKRK